MRKARKDGKCLKILPEKKKIYLQNYKEKYPEKAISRKLARKLPIQPCEICGSTENAEKHHEDYSKPNDITWLCRKYHYERHVEIRHQQLLNARKEEN